MIKINNLTKRYNKDKIVLENINLEIPNGESIGILGANGSGKSTLVEIIAGINEQTSGEVLFLNQNNETDKELKESIGIQFQKGDWPFNTRAVDLLNLLVGKKWSSSEYINELIDIFEVKSIINKRLNECSGGEQQRFNSLLSIIKKPRILILDELITGLDLKMQMKLINFFDELKKKEDITLIIISHIPEEIEQICKRVIVLNEGKIYKDAKVVDIVKEHGSVRLFLNKYFKEINNEIQ
ncbi:ATP-binding cassette domain-containing protein [Spiroplasma apis]|uniref:Antibiotic transport system ATP-binding protein n=1 Tax=Spiroplasma apis B31 TaxID=1276258 RepID=V5RIB4_SPIAP|nr:ABC transporter ATP-binding protein [Spiroplasma apis]AHB36294.1 antibiotic transport system ATP-binding protein [Spiroplasma apis B31]